MRWDLIVTSTCSSSNPGCRRRRLAQQIYRRLLGLTVPVDVIVATPEDVERYRDKIGLIIGPSLEEGRVVYGSVANTKGRRALPRSGWRRRVGGNLT